MNQTMVRGLLLSLGLAACGGAGTEDGTGASKEADSVIGPGTQPLQGNIGTGWDSKAQSYRGVCGSFSLLDHRLGQPSGSALTDISVDRSQVETELGFDISAKARYALASGSASAHLATSMREDDYSDVFVFRATYDLGNLAMDQGSFQTNALGADAERNLRWNETCGDEVITQIKSGASFYFVERIDFKSREAKSRFNAAVGLQFSGGVASGELDTKLQQAARDFRQSARVRIEVHQIGGNPAAIGLVLNGIGGTPQVGGDGASAIVDCAIDDLAKCRQARINAIQYTGRQQGGLYEQLGDPRYATSPTAYLTQSWTILGKNPVNRILTQEIAAIRTTLQQKFEPLLGWKVRIDRLLMQAVNWSIPAEQLTDLQGWRSRLEADLGLVNDAVVACYDALTFDPGGQPLAAKVTACQQAVDRVPSEQPPQDLMTAAGRYQIDYRYRADGLSRVLGDYAQGSQRVCVRDWGSRRIRCEDHPVRLPPEAVGKGQIGLRQLFERGEMYWSPETDAHEVHGDILGSYLAIGGANPPVNADQLDFGFPITDELHLLGGGARSDFERGSIFWKDGIGARPTYGPVRDKYFERGGDQSPLGYPIGLVARARDGGVFQYFEGGAIYGGHGLGAHEIHGSIFDTWFAAQSEWGPYGFPVTDEVWELGGLWRHEDFEGGAIYYSDALAQRGQNAIFELRGNIGAKYKTQRGADTNASPIGYPTSGEVTTARNDGSCQTFERGAIYERTARQAFAMVGAIYAKWAELGYERTNLPWERFGLGFPTSDEQDLGQVRSHGDGRVSFFEGGRIVWSPATGAHALYGLFVPEWDRWKQVCGLPVDDPHVISRFIGKNYRRVNYEGGNTKVFQDGTFETKCPSDD